MNRVYPHESRVVQQVHWDLVPHRKQLREVSLGQFSFERPVAVGSDLVEIREHIMKRLDSIEDCCLVEVVEGFKH